MHRLIVALLSALDALIQVAGGLAVIAAPLTALWVFGLGGTADWAALWPSTAAVWHAGNLVPLQVTLPDTLIAAGISSDAASFAFSLAPLGFAAFTIIFGVRSGARAARSGAWFTGFVSALFVAGALSTVIALTSNTDVVSSVLWQAIVIPAALYAVSVLTGGIVSAWRNGDDGAVDTFRDALERRGAADAVISATALGVAVTVATLIGVGAVVLAGAVAMSGGEIAALYQAGNVDILGAIVVTLGQVAYIPTLIVWTISWIAGPGFAIGTGSTVSPVGTDLAVVPSIPVLGAVPDASDAWLLLVALIPVAAGALGGWFARSRLHAVADGPTDAIAPRLVTTLAMSVVSALATAGMAIAASGAIGPGRLADVGPQAGPLAFAIGVEVFVGAAILLLSPLSHERSADDSPPGGHGDQPVAATPETRDRAFVIEDDQPTAPIAPLVQG
ncbi:MULTISPECIES: cell division protein PerM [Bacteria]